MEFREATVRSHGAVQINAALVLLAVCGGRRSVFWYAEITVGHGRES
jgi:hypothetical protein